MKKMKKKRHRIEIVHSLWTHWNISNSFFLYVSLKEPPATSLKTYKPAPCGDLFCLKQSIKLLSARTSAFRNNIVRLFELYPFSHRSNFDIYEATISGSRT